jgi:thiazole/oxazole-forming peptide maturase SagD family component
MIEQDYRPLVVLYGYRSKRNTLSFVGRKGLIMLSGKSAIVDRILRLCNGFNDVADITRKLRTVSLEEVTEFLSLFEQQGIVCDSRDLYLKFHEDSANPAKFSRDLGVDGVSDMLRSERLRKREGKTIKISIPIASSILDAIRNRRSTRAFRSGQIPMAQLSGILEATYSVGKNKHWSVASGGGMYPLDLYLIVPDDNQQVPKGIYRWNPEERSLTTISGKNPSVWLSKVFNAKTILENAACILCIAADFKRSTTKYSNLGYRLTLLEAGHAAQNTYVFCAEQNIGIVECCGFADEALANELGLMFPDEAVLATLIMGKFSVDAQTSTPDQEVSEKAERLRYILVGDKKPIKDVLFLDLKVDGYVMPMWSATASYRPIPGRLTASMKRKSVGFATGSTSSEALLKVLAEGFERYALEQNRSDRRESANGLNEPFLDPRVLVPYSGAQFKNLRGITRFDPRRKINWVIGSRRATGERIWVPMEIAYYATEQMKRELKLCYQASSSGVAAHFDKEVAIDTALYELIERDAFSVTWYSKRRVNSINHECLPLDLRCRISEWKRLGYNVSILDLTLDGPPVALAIIWSREKRPAISSGAACRPSFTDATLKAFNEAEFMAMTWRYHRSKLKMEMSEINSPESHGIFYLDPKNLVYADWLLEAEESDVIREGFKGDLQYLDPIVVDITPKDHTCGLSVMRVLSEKLMPVNFGYGNEHRGHSRMDMLSFEWSEKYPSTPHFFA